MKAYSVAERQRNLLQIILIGIILGSIYSVLEYTARVGTGDPQSFIPLFIRANVAAITIFYTVSIFENKVYRWLRKMAFAPLVLIRSIAYTFIISFILSIINGIWGMIDRGLSFSAAIWDYVSDESYIVNLITILMMLAIFIAFREINSLHRKGELLEFILGRYHKPKEINRIL